MAWLGSWAKRFPLHIDYTKVSSGLSAFTVPIRLSAAAGIDNDDLSAVFDDLGVNKLKLAVTTDDEVTQCYVEVSYWDNSAELAVLWVRVPSVSSSVATDLYLYFDPAQSDNTSYVGVPASAAAVQVWDDESIGVWPLHETPGGAGSTIDSTKNSINGTPTNAPISAQGLLGYGYDVERTDNSHVIIPKASTCPDSSSHAHVPTAVGVDIQWSNSAPIDGGGVAYFNNATRITYDDSDDWTFGGGTGPFTLELWAKWVSLPGSGTHDIFLSRYSNLYWSLYNNAGTYEIRFYQGSPAVSVIKTWSGIASGTWYHIAISRDSSGDYRVFIDGSQIGSTTNDTSDIYNSTAVLEIGTFNNAQNFYGSMDEFRISTVARYTSNFTPQTTQFDDDANTSLLLHFEPEHASVRGLSKATIECLIKLESHPGNGLYNFLWYESTGVSGTTKFGISAYGIDASNMSFRAHHNAGTAYTATDPAYCAAATWYHVAATVNADTELLALYVNGTKVAEDTSAKVAFPSGVSTNDIAIGRYTHSTPQNADGIFEAVRISRTDRSASWIGASYSALFDDLLTFDAVELPQLTVAFGAPPGVVIQAYSMSMQLLALYVNTFSAAPVEVAAYNLSVAIISAIVAPGNMVFVGIKPRALWTGAVPVASWSMKNLLPTWSGKDLSAGWTLKRPHGVFDSEG